jgi:predicted aconitase with swiveling domain
MIGRMISPGNADGVAIVSHEPIGFYGGVDAKTGDVIDKGHELEGQCIADKILVFPCAKGSTVGSYVIYGLKKNGVAPKAIINEETETIVATGVILAGIPCVDKINLAELNLSTGDRVKVDADSAIVEKYV